MRKFLPLVCVIVFSGLVRAQENYSDDQQKNSPVSGKKNYMFFTQNDGQIIDSRHQLRPDVLFKGEADNNVVYLRKSGFSYVVSNIGKLMHSSDKQFLEPGIPQFLKTQRIDISFLNADSSAEILPSDKIDGYSNYYYSHCPQGITHVSSYHKVVVKNMYNNIDLNYYSSEKREFEYDIVVNPGGNPKDLEVQYTGAQELKIENGKLKIETVLGDLGEYMPRVYQVIDGKTVNIQAEYVLKPTSSEQVKTNSEQRTGEDVPYIITFKLGTFDSQFPLIIDPAYWGTCYGGSVDEFGLANNIDLNGNTLITGFTESSDFPFSPGAFQQVYMGGTGKILSQDPFAAPGDAFIVKFSPSGARMWATYYGGSNNEFGDGIATDADSNVIFTGQTNSTDFPVVGGYQMNFGGQSTAPSPRGDAFVVKFDHTGLRTWATFYGGSRDETGYAVTCDHSGNIAITGNTNSSNLPGATGVYRGSASNWSSGDAFVAEFSAAGGFLWSTYYGGSSDECGQAITADANGNIAITGYTQSTNAQVLLPFQKSIGGKGATNAFVVVYSGGGTMQWATYYGGSASDNGIGIGTDSGNNFVVSGTTNSTDFPVTAGAYQTSNTISAAGGTPIPSAGFLAKFTGGGVPVWSTYYNVHNLGGGVAALDLDDKDNSYVLYNIEGSNGNTVLTTCAFQNTYNSVAVGNGGFQNSPSSEHYLVSKFTAGGNFSCSTYVEGKGEDEGGNDDFWNLFTSTKAISVWHCKMSITGATSGLFPTTPGSFQPERVAAADWCAFVIDLNTFACGDTAASTTLTISATTPATICTGKTVNFAPTYASCDTSFSTYLWTFQGGTPSTSTLPNPTGISYNQKGNYDVKLVIHTPCTADSVTNRSYITVTGLSSDTSSTPDVCNNTNGTAAIVNVSGNNGIVTYTWNIDSTKSSVSNLSAGTYSVTISDAIGCSQTATVTVLNTGSVNVNAGRDTLLCAGASVTLKASPTGANSYTWSNASSLSSSSVFNPVATPPMGITTYVVTVNDNGCVGKDSVTVTVAPYPVKNKDTTISTTSVQSILLNGLAAGGTSYRWSPVKNLNDSTGANPGFGPAPAGTYVYQVKVSNGAGCAVYDTVMVDVTELICNGHPPVFLPTAFSPNNDGHNDVLFVRPAECIQSFTFQVFNRWGEEVFTTTNPDSGWDGTYRGKACDAGVFIYYFSGTFMDGITFSQKGNVTLLR